MTTQTRTQRQAAAKKAAATRKRNAARRSNGAARASARRTAASAQTTTRAASATARQAARGNARRLSAETTRLGSIARQAERAILIPVGAVLEARDRLGATVRSYRDGRVPLRQLNRFERRGATAVRRYRRLGDRQVRTMRRRVESRANEVQSWAGDLIARTRGLA